MKVIKAVVTVAVSVLMLAYMMSASVLWSVDMSIDEKNIQNVLGSSDVLSSLVQTAGLELSYDLEENAEDIVEKFGGDPEDVRLTEMYRLPEVTALFANVFTNSARYVLYGEEYSEVDEELVRQYICAVVNYNIGRKASEAELDDYLAVSLGVYTERFNETIANMVTAFSADEEVLGTVRFLFNDIKVISTVASVVHMLVLLLIIKGKLGYFTNASVFGVSGIGMLVMGAALSGVTGGGSASSLYAQMLAEILRNKFALIGAILFIISASLFVAAMAISICRIPKGEEE